MHSDATVLVAFSFAREAVLMLKRIAIGSWTFASGHYERTPLSLDAVFEMLGRLGFDGVSLGGYKPHAHPDLYATPEEKKRLKAGLCKNGLEAVEYMPVLWAFNPLLEEREYLAGIERNLRFMEECGFHILHVDTGCPPLLPDGMSYAEARSRIVGLFREIATECARRNMSVAWEFEPAFLFNKPGEVADILAAVGMANFNLLFDTAHAHMSAVMGANHLGEKEILPGGVTEFIAMVSGKIGLVHLADSDNTLHRSGTSTHAALGTGVVDLGEIVPALLHKGKYEFGWWVIDLFDMADAEKAVVEGKAVVEQLIVNSE